MTPTTRARFEARYPFPLDSFQLDALDALDAGDSVLVAAPTGSGKTLVAEYAVACALEGGPRHPPGKVFYTTPIKALSNQKFHDLRSRHGADNVGLLTGDNSINGEAPVVVMTTEVLRNMLYAASPTLHGLRYVILDEVHYLQDPYRGPVWEEVIIHTPLEVDFVCLSATVSNANEFAEWMSTVRGRTTPIVATTRPVELRQLVLVGDRESGEVELVPLFVDGRLNPEAARLDEPGTAAQKARARARSSGFHATRHRRSFVPSRPDVIEALWDADLLPAIYFIFSRAACSEAVNACRSAGLRLTSPQERAAIDDIVMQRVDALSDVELDVLGFAEFHDGMLAGLASHHAGMVPAFKEAVEACFTEGLVKAVFATETLALGINMPARSVVIEKLTKFGGERHELLTPGEFTQLTGRAGRRGIDEIGYAGVVWSPWISQQQVAELASARSFELTSAFRPTYNMTVNLVASASPERVHQLLRLSFAQFRADAALTRMNAEIETVARALDAARAAAACERGDIDEYRRRMGIGDARSDDARSDRGRSGSERSGSGAIDGAAVSAAVGAALERLRPGDVLELARPPGAAIRRYGDDGFAGPGSRARPSGSAAATRDLFERFVLVLSTARRRGRDAQIKVVGVNGRVATLSTPDFAAPPEALRHIDLAMAYVPSSRSYQKAAAGALEAAVRRELRARRDERPSRHHPSPHDDDRPRGGRRSASSSAADGVGVESCPDLVAHLRAAAKASRLERDLAALKRDTTDRRASLVGQFERVRSLLGEGGYLDGWVVSDHGRMLAAIFHECDLLIAECLRAGLFDGLNPPALAALASVFVYEPRGPALVVDDGPRRGRGVDRDRDERRHQRDDDVPRGLPRSLLSRWRQVEAIADDLGEAERERGLTETRRPDPGFATTAQRWASGRPLEKVLDTEELSGGDFVRVVRTLIDLLRQLSQAAPVPETAAAARAAADGLFRGVVRAASTLDDPEVEPDTP